MAKKRNLSDLIAEETQQTESSANQSVSTEVSESVTTLRSDSQSTKATNFQTNEVPNSETNRVTELQTTKVTDSKSTAVPNFQTNKVTELQSNELSNSVTNVLSNSQTESIPKYLTLVRKEARLREDQLDELTSLARSLNRKRQGSGERITENTLIRIAVDLLMNHKSQLKGTTEQELSASVELD